MATTTPPIPTRSFLGKLGGLSDSFLHHRSLAGGRLGAALRFVHWQVGKAIGARRALVRVGPIRFYCYPGNASASAAWYFGLPEWDEMTFLLRYLRDGDWFIDVGANVGIYTLLAASRGPGVRVTAIEPDSETFTRLGENVELNRFSNVGLISAAVGGAEGTAVFTVGRDTENRLARAGESQVATLPMTTLDRVAGADRPALIKIDVEGSELSVLQGARDILKSEPGPALFFEINNSCFAAGYTPRDIASFLGEHRYSLHEYDAEKNMLRAYDAATLPRSGNVIATKDADALMRRLASNENGAALSSEIAAHLEW